MCEPCNYTSRPPNSQTTPLCPQKRKLCDFLETSTATTSERECKVVKTHHHKSYPTFTEISPAWELDLSSGLNVEFQSFLNQNHYFAMSSFGEGTQVSLGSDEFISWMKKQEEGSCRLHGAEVVLNEVQLLERERFPGFTFLSLEEQLDHVADCLWFKFPHYETVKLMKLFNLVNHDRQDIWNSPVCGNPTLLNRLINRLRQSQNLTKSQSISEFQSEGFHLLGLLARSGSGRDGISSQGGFRLIIDQIRQTDHVEVYRYCCFALGNLVTSMVDDAEGSFRQVIEQEQVIQMMLDTLKLKFDNWKIVQQICFAIGNLAFIGDFEEIIVNKKKGIDLVLAAMKKHQKFPLMMTDAIFFLKNFAFGENGRLAIIANGGISHILTTMAMHLHSLELLELGINLLFDLSFSGAVNIIMQDATAIQLILDAIQIHQDKPNLIREALRTISRIYSICNIKQKKIIIQTNVIQILRNLVTTATQSTFLKQIMNAFSLFSREDISHEKKPHCRLTLMELCARKIVDASVKFCANFLPRELVTYLYEQKSCGYCGRSFFDSYFEVISFSKFPEFRAPLPVFWKVCSQQCFNNAKINK